MRKRLGGTYLRRQQARDRGASFLAANYQDNPRGRRLDSLCFAGRADLTHSCAAARPAASMAKLESRSTEHAATSSASGTQARTDARCETAASRWAVSRQGFRHPGGRATTEARCLSSSPRPRAYPGASGRISKPWPASGAPGTAGRGGLGRPRQPGAAAAREQKPCPRSGREAATGRPRPSPGREVRTKARYAGARTCAFERLRVPARAFLLRPTAPIVVAICNPRPGARYALLEQWRQDRSLDWVLTAHHAVPTRPKTLLMRLNRGAGVAGLGGDDAAPMCERAAAVCSGWRRATSWPRSSPSPGSRPSPIRAVRTKVRPGDQGSSAS